jgi:hypothetical protein
MAIGSTSAFAHGVCTTVPGPFLRLVQSLLPHTLNLSLHPCDPWAAGSALQHRHAIDSPTNGVGCSTKDTLGASFDVLGHNTLRNGSCPNHLSFLLKLEIVTHEN